VSVDREKTLEHVFAIAREAGEGISRIYAGKFEVEYKSANDPVTRADREANDFICDALSRAYPGMPIVAEESDPATYAGFGKSPQVWFVDPLDGTREFVARNGEFAVMIGLAENGRAVLGVLVCPALHRSFIGAEGMGAFEVNDQGDRKAIHVSSHEALAGARVLVSRSHLPDEARARMNELGLVMVPCGSAGVKAAKIACGEADLYAQPGRAGKLWDACAPEAVVRAAGGVWRTTTGDGYDYQSESLENGRGVVAGNPKLVEAVVAVKW
jgi:3'(2'), 5'-bisphosphate nucleotidase